MTVAHHYISKIDECLEKILPLLDTNSDYMTNRDENDGEGKEKRGIYSTQSVFHSMLFIICFYIP